MGDEEVGRDTADSCCNELRFGASAINEIDHVNGCHRFAVEAQLDHGEAVAWSGRMTLFYAAGPDAGRMRICDGGSALAAPEFTTVIRG